MFKLYANYVFVSIVHFVKKVVADPRWISNERLSLQNSTFPPGDARPETRALDSLTEQPHSDGAGKQDGCLDVQTIPKTLNCIEYRAHSPLTLKRIDTQQQESG